MSVHVLQVEPRDVCAANLGLVVGAPAPVPLAELVLGGAHVGVVLGVLGASHVVTVSSSGSAFTEQVSCDALGMGGEHLPADASRGGYRFRSSTAVADELEFAALAERLRQRSAREPNWLCGTFPGQGTAVTVLTAQVGDGLCSWKSWHLYPSVAGGGTIVTTESRWRA